MTAMRYVCCDEGRRAALLAPGAPANLSGIDYIEVAAGATTADPTIIDIVLVKPLSLGVAALDGSKISIEGGVRFAPPQVAPDVEEIPAAGPVERYRVVIPGNQQTDFSTYRLSIVQGPTNRSPPSFIDPRLAAVDFSFKVGCPSDFDCAPCASGDEPQPPEPPFDYRVRDYQGFRRQLLDRMVQLVPDFREDDPVDFTTTLVEAAAYTADQLSYRLDWIGTEAFLQTARSRTSIARHARLLDYSIGEGASARTFVQFEFTPGSGSAADGKMTLASGTPLLLRDRTLPDVIGPAAYRGLLRTQGVIFETVAPLTLWEWRNHIPFHTWSDDECRLPRGSTTATLVRKDPPSDTLAPGDLVILLETRSPETGEEADARSEHRHAVRLTRVDKVEDPLNVQLKLIEIAWGEENALPFDLIIQAPNPGAAAGAGTIVCAEARGNVTLADHGASFPPINALGLQPSDVEALTPTFFPDEPPVDGRWRPVLDRGSVSRIDPVDLRQSPPQPAHALDSVNPARATVAISLNDDFGTWRARRDLLRSGRFDRDFVVETSIDGRLAVRFGDDTNGMAPTAGTELRVRGRFGTGLEGNIGADALAHVVLPVTQKPVRLTVTNPLPARGGAEPEPVSAIRIAAPQAFRTQERAVAEADYATAAKCFADVSNAVAVARWTGAWQTMFVYVDRREGRRVDDEFAKGLANHLERYRLMGFDVSVVGAKPAPLDIQLQVCVSHGAVRTTVAARVAEALRPYGGGGRPGFFHPDHFTFGSPLYASRLIAAVMAVDGVQSVQLLRFRRFGRLPQDEIAIGVIRPNEFEILQLSDDPSFPEQGRLSLVMGGGR